MFEKVLASIGVGSTKIDTVIYTQDIYPSQNITGKINIFGGNVAQEISGIKLALKTQAKIESGEQKYYANHVIESWEISEKFIINPKENIYYDFDILIHNETPMTNINLSSRPKVWLDTELEIDLAIDSHDTDFLNILMPKPVENFLHAMSDLGFRLFKSDVESGYINVPSYSWQTGCYQEFEFKSKGFSSIREVEATFIIKPQSIDILLELDRAFRGDEYKMITINQHDSIQSIKSKLGQYI
jgi:sporulation-control protein